MKHRARSKFARIALLLLGGLMLPIISAWAEQKIPDAKIRVTIQQKEAGKLNPALHVQELVCTNGGCSLTSITINDCRPSPASNGVASPIIIERSSTIGGDLKITNEGNTLVAIETNSDIGGDSVTTQRFKYEKPRDNRIITKLIGYSGGFVKNSIVAQQVLTVEYVPLTGQNRGAYKEIKLDCPMGLPGIDVSE